ncbi:hypothetical protein M758_10G054100 [Ceratodon purpureus]|nr:hypothetical protein M758_10G054100 [Ceratodon purpureus]
MSSSSNFELDKSVSEVREIPAPSRSERSRETPNPRLEKQGRVEKQALVTSLLEFIDWRHLGMPKSDDHCQ